MKEAVAKGLTKHKVHQVLLKKELTSLIIAYIFTSSANNLTVRPEPKMSTISLINIRKRTGGWVHNL